MTSSRDVDLGGMAPVDTVAAADSMAADDVEVGEEEGRPMGYKLPLVPEDPAYDDAQAVPVGPQAWGKRSDGSNHKIEWRLRTVS